MDEIEINQINPEFFYSELLKNNSPFPVLNVVSNAFALENEPKTIVITNINLFIVFIINSLLIS